MSTVGHILARPASARAIPSMSTSTVHELDGRRGGLTVQPHAMDRTGGVPHQ